MSVPYVLSQTIYVFTTVLKVLFFVRVLLAWFPKLSSRGGVIGSVVSIVNALTEPILGPLRRLLAKSPLGGGMIDFSPILAYFLLDAAALLMTQIVGAFGVA